MKSKLVEAYKEERKEIFNKKFGVTFNGDDNLKPLIIENLIDSSPTATQCAWIYQTFLGGGGFENDLAEIDLANDWWDVYTPNDLLFDICEPLSRHQGCFIHVGYNANFQKAEFSLIPYSLCRLGKLDSDKYAGKVIVSPNGWGKYLKKEDVRVYDTYNPNPIIIQKQVETCGGWENYSGQIIYFKLSDKYTYTKSLIEVAYTFAQTENHMGMYYVGTVKRSFEDISMIRHRKFDDKQDEQNFYNNIKSISGLENANSKLIIEDDWDDEREKTGNIRIDTIKNDVKPEKYAHFENSSANYIRKSFKNIPPQLVDYIAGKLGNTSGEDLIKAQSIYNSLTSRDRQKIEMLFRELFRNYIIPIQSDWKIKQYALLDDGTAGNSNETSEQSTSYEDKLNKESQATLRGSVGGVTGVLSIQTSVSQKITDYDSGLAMLEEIFGYSTEVAKRILGNPIEKETADETIN